MKPTNNYLPHVDGLRALAVMIVIFYHLDWSFLPGGFVGVDVFFVISGYLITALLRKEYEVSGTIEYKRFFLRRAKRILPALFFVALISFILGMLFFSPGYFKDLWESIVASLFSVSNFYFFVNADYFDSGSLVKPLLHTWSLGVEEQFYLIWPLLLVFIYKLGNGRFVLFFVLALCLLSLLFNVIWGWFGLFGYSPAGLNMKSAVFYMLPFRAYEFAIGAALTWINLSIRAKGVLAELLCLTGLLMIIISAIQFNELMLFPYWYAVIPCLGAALFIVFGGHTTIGMVLNNPFSVSLGLISYSVYLVHWPIIVFWNYVGGSISLIEQIAILMLVLLLAFLLYRYIETPFRAKVYQRKKSLYIVIVGSLLIGSVIHSTITNGWVWRIPLASYDLANAEDTTEFHRSNYGAAGYSQDSPGYTNESPDILIMGDSHGRQYMEGLFKEVIEPNGLSYQLLAGTSCLYLPGFTRTSHEQDYDVLCSEMVSQSVHTVVRSDSPPVVIISHLWREQIQLAGIIDDDGELVSDDVSVDDVIAGLLELKSLIGPARLVVIGNVPRSNVELYDVATRPVFFRNSLGLDEYAFRLRDNSLETLNNQLKLAGERTGAYDFFDPFDYLCDEVYCRNIGENGEILYSDKHHLSKAGSILVVRGLKEKLLQILN